MHLPRWLVLSLAILAAAAPAAPAAAAQRPAPPGAPPDEVVEDFEPVTAAFDHVRREEMIPMRDGTRLNTIIIIPRRLAGPAPIILTRTPYGAGRASSQSSSPRAAMVLPPADEALLEAGYIRVYQDIRGRYDSEGAWAMTLPPRGPLNRSQVDETTDTWDTIQWLVDHLDEDNGRVGLTGVSYPGWLTLMGLLEPHPALRAAVPMFPMVDGWIGDDFYHNGALRQTMFEWLYGMGTSRDASHRVPFGYRDMYEAFLDAGSADAVARRYGAEGLPSWRKIVDNPAYTEFWSGQAVHDMLRRTRPTVPTLFVHGLFDQEDNYGGIAAYQAFEAQDAGNDRVFLAVGPWSHGQSQREGSSLGAIPWHADTSRWFREEVLLPFWNLHLRDQPPARPIAPVTAFETGANRWREYPAWPAPGTQMRRLYLQDGGRLAFREPTAAGAPTGEYDEYVSDPARPVPYRVRPVLAMYDADSTWSRWLVDDQRPFSDRPDVLTFVSEPLTEPLTIGGDVIAHLVASTTGTDADWVVKLIDVYPPEVRETAELGGYQLMVSGDIMRGRYRENPSEARPITPGTPLDYRVRLPNASHTFRPGHRIMVQIQSSWFPLYDRNPQTFVDNIARAQPRDYVAATQRIWFRPGQASYIELPVAEGR